MSAPDGAAKRYVRGTHRVRPPEETWEWIVGLLARVGVTRLADVTQLDRLGIPVWQSIRPASRNLSVSQGKALTHTAARVSAAMESVELWHAECLDHLPQATLSLREMQYGNPIPAERFHWRPDCRLLDAAPLAWVPARSLTRNREGWLPRAMVQLDFRVPRGLQPQMFHLTSNGLASGNTEDEAVVHALCEVIERHGLFLGYEGAIEQVPVEPDTVPEDSRALLDRIESAGMRFAIYDLTWDVGIPTFLVELVAGDLANVWRGSGCHLAPDVALARAITEAAQSRLTYIAGARDDITPFREQLDVERVFREYAPPSPRRSFADIPNLATGRVTDDRDIVVTALDGAGYEPFLLDLRREDLGVPVVFAFVPGFREAPYG